MEGNDACTQRSDWLFLQTWLFENLNVVHIVAAVACSMQVLLAKGEDRYIFHSRTRVNIRRLAFHIK